MNGTINSNKKMSFKYLTKLIGIIFLSILVGKVGTAYLIGNELDLSLYFTFVVTAIISFLLSFVIVSPKLKAISLKQFLTKVLPLSLMFLVVFTIILNQFTTLL